MDTSDISAQTESFDGLTQLKGTVEHIIYSNEDNAYTVFDVGTEDDDVITAFGTLPYIGAGDALILWGSWVHNVKYGRQFKVEQYERAMPADSAAILRYLSSRTIKGIGPKIAARIVEEFGDETLDVMENHPEWLAQVPGISRKRASEIAEDFKAKAGIRSAMLFFREYFGAALTVRIYKTLGSGAVDIAKKNPYRLCDEVEGIGFEKADRLAMALGVDPAGDDRLMSGMTYVLSSNAARNGHTCLPSDKLLEASAQMLHTELPRVTEVLAHQLASGRLVKRRFDGRDYIFEAAQDKAERYIVDKMTLLDKLCPAVDAGDVSALIEREERKQGMNYAAEQKKAIYHALEHGVMVLTGGPGTGKTTVVHALIRIFSAMHMEVALTAPTGRAAKRLSEATSTEAKTIHRLLEMDFSDGGHGRFRRNEQDLLEEHVIIVDEASMVDNALMCALLKAIKPGARLILIGDADQLPSVGAGRVLNDLVDSGRFATVRLKEIFRQAQASLIVTNAHAVNRGEMPTLTVKDNDFFFLPRRYDRTIAETVVELCKTRLPRTYGKETEGGIQIITPSRRGEAGTDNLNHLMQAALNPPAANKRELVFRETVFREGDRVMQIKNNYDIPWESEHDGNEDGEGSGVFNGDIGTVVSVSRADGEMRVRFDNREAIYLTDMLDELEHAWAVTVHKSQGSEYPFVIIPLYGAPPLLLTRNLLYTAITRARRMVILVGREDILQTMVENNRQSMRYTGLLFRLIEQK